MRPTITCTACGTVLGIPKAGIPKDGLSCNWCGYVNLPAAEPAPVPTGPVPLPATTSGTVQEPAADNPPAYQWGDDEDDNGLPYSLPQEESKTRKCVDCGKEIDILAVVCVHCGYDAEGGRKVERTYQPIDRTWEAGWPLKRRLAVFAVLQAINALSLGASLGGGGSVSFTVGGVLFYVALQAFLVGTYDAVRIRRNKKGQAEITVTWRVAFVQMAAQKVNWREHEGVVFGHYDATSVIDWLMVILLLPACILPAILFWFYVIRSDRYFAALSRDHEYPAIYLYRGMNEAQAMDICQVASDATGLKLVRPLK